MNKTPLWTGSKSTTNERIMPVQPQSLVNCVSWVDWHMCSQAKRERQKKKVRNTLFTFICIFRPLTHKELFLKEDTQPWSSGIFFSYFWYNLIRKQWASVSAHNQSHTHSDMIIVKYTWGWGRGEGRRGGKEGDRAHSRGRPQEEHPDGPPLFVRVLGTPLRSGGTQGGILHPRLTPPLPKRYTTSNTAIEGGGTDTISDQPGGGRAGMRG